jgi:hypothetical protein
MQTVKELTTFLLRKIEEVENGKETMQRGMALAYMAHIAIKSVLVSLVQDKGMNIPIIETETFKKLEEVT